MNQMIAAFSAATIGFLALYTIVLVVFALYYIGYFIADTSFLPRIAGEGRITNKEFRELTYKSSLQKTIFPRHVIYFEINGKEESVRLYHSDSFRVGGLVKVVYRVGRFSGKKHIEGIEPKRGWL